MNTPTKFVAHYECEPCGESLEMWNFRVPTVHVLCECDLDIGEHMCYFTLKYITYGLFE